MPVDPSIIGGIKSPVLIDPLKAQAAAVDLTNAKLETQGNQLKLRAMQQASEDDLALRLAMQQANGDPAAASKILKTLGKFGAAAAIDKQIQDAQESKAKAQKVQLDTAIESHKLASQILQGANEHNWAMARRMFVGAFGKDAASDLPEQFDRHAIDAVIAAGRDPGEQLTAARDKIAADTAAAELPGKVAESAQKKNVAANMSGGLTADQRADNANAQGQLAVSQGNLSVARGRLAVEQQKEKREAAAKAEGVQKLPAGVAQQVAGVEQSVSVLNDLRKTKKDEWLGPLWGRKAELELKIPGVAIPKDLARFAAQTATLKNSVIKAITGAQMSEPEAKRIANQIPQFTDKPEVWDEKALATDENMRLLRKRLIELSGGTAGELPSNATAAPIKVGKYTVTVK